MKRLCALAFLLLVIALATMAAPAHAGYACNSGACCTDPQTRYLCCYDIDNGAMNGSDAVTIGDLRVGRNHVYRVDKTVRIVNPRPGESALGREVHFVNGKGQQLPVFDWRGKFRVPSKFLFVHWDKPSGAEAAH